MDACTQMILQVRGVSSTRSGMGIVYFSMATVIAIMGCYVPRQAFSEELDIVCTSSHDPLCRAEYFALDDQTLLARTLDQSDSIAVQAMWEVTIRRIKERTGAEATRRELNRFIGFVEGRLRLTVPTTWHEVLRDGGIDRDTNAFGPCIQKYSDKWQSPRYQKMIPAEFGTARWKGEEIVYDDDLGELVVPNTVTSHSRKNGGGCGYLEVTRTEKEVFLGLHGGFSHSARWTLAAVDARTNRSIWITTVIGDTMPFWAGGPAFQRAWINVGNDTVWVFCSNSNSMQIEGFKRTTGAATFRFSTFSFPRPAAPSSEDGRRGRPVETRRDSETDKSISSELSLFDEV